MNRGTLILILLALFLLTLALHAGGGWVSFFALILPEMLMTLAWVGSAALLGAVILRLGRIRANASLMLASSAALGLGLWSLAALGLGLAGWLNRPAVFALLALGPASFLAHLLARHRSAWTVDLSSAAEAWLQEKPASIFPWLIVALFAALAVAAAALPPGLLWPADPNPYDVLEYHLQMPREWFEAGRITPPLHNVYGFFPFNVEMQYLLAMHLRGGAWQAMYLAHGLTLAYMAMAVVAVHGIGRMIHGNSARAAALGAAVMAAVPWITMLGTLAYNEAGLLLYGTLAAGWCLAAMRNPAESWRTMLLAGTMAGLACGTKYTAVPIVLLAVPAVYLLLGGRIRPETAAATLQADESQPPRPWRRALLGCGLYLAAGAMAFSPWLVRNLVWTGNPVFPEAMGLLGRAHFSPQQAERWEQAHAPRQDQRPILKRLAALRQEVFKDARYGFLLWGLAVAGAALGWGRSEARFLVGVMLVLAVFWVGFTHLQSRFFALAVPLAAILAGYLAAPMAGRIVALATLFLMTLLGFLQLHSIAYPPLRSMGEAEAFGIEDLSRLFFPEAPYRFISPQTGPSGEIRPKFNEFLSARLAEGSKIAMVGDAKAFIYPIPTSRLRYRTVFDVDAKAGQSALDAWLGAEAEAIRRSHYIIIDPAELRRFHATYARVPLPTEWAEAREPVVLAPQ